MDFSSITPKANHTTKPKTTRPNRLPNNTKTNSRTTNIGLDQSLSFCYPPVSQANHSNSVNQQGKEQAKPNSAIKLNEAFRKQHRNPTRESISCSFRGASFLGAFCMLVSTEPRLPWLKRKLGMRFPAG